METRREIAWDRTLPFARYLMAQAGSPVGWDAGRQKITGNLAGTAWTYRFPLTLPLCQADQDLDSFLDSLSPTPESYLLILIQAGHSAMAYFEGGEMVHHKVIKKYMVRGNGKSQVGYLQTRGKSKAGSRIRLANSVTFFEDINEKLREWDVVDQAVRILVSCPVALQSMWFQSRISPPFDKDDHRISKVPINVHRPDMEELKRVNLVMQRGLWEGPAVIVDAFFAEAQPASTDFED